MERGFVSFEMMFDYGGAGQGVGGICTYNPSTDMYGDCTGYLVQNVCKTVGVDRLEDLKGKHCRVTGTNSKVHSIQHLLKDGKEFSFISGLLAFIECSEAERNREPKTPYRVEVHEFAKAMEAKLAEHDCDRGDSWKRAGSDRLLKGLGAEVAELKQELSRGTVCLENVRGEAADVANFAMMIFDNHDK
jgi:NTP pyrophosphatase (non-canonical NTP hydrolase)